MTTTEVDGRRLRRERNREAVIDALVQLFDEGSYQPTTDEIAERAGLSPRSLFRYFDDIDDLNRAAVERELARAQPMLEVGVSADAPTADKIDGILEARLRMWEAIEPAARAARLNAHRRPVIAAQLVDGRAFLRRQLRELFAPELAGDRASLLGAIEVLTSFESYDLLRVDQRLSRAKTVSTLTSALRALLIP
ncbi:MAG TPA: TetR/AcrR family transcriptional regulator [Acidimicrobiales bacterium]|nr:TetR/AcrR family transcriptional regulator [Acidimicrobiales bacterium]